MPILGQDHMGVRRGQSVDRGDDRIALRNRERPAKAEIVLHVDDKKDILIGLLHGLTRKRGMISRAMISTWSVRYRYGMKISFCIPTAGCARSCRMHSSTVPMIAPSFVESLHAA